MSLSWSHGANIRQHVGNLGCAIVYIKKLLRNWGALDRLIAHTYWNTWALSFKKLRDPGNWMATGNQHSCITLAQYCPGSHLTVFVLVWWAELAPLCWVGPTWSRVLRVTKKCYNRQPRVYLHNEWQKAGLFEAIFACKWMWKINQEVSVGRYPIEEAKISPMAWEQI